MKKMKTRLLGVCILVVGLVLVLTGILLLSVQAQETKPPPMTPPTTNTTQHTDVANPNLRGGFSAATMALDGSSGPPRYRIAVLGEQTTVNVWAMQDTEASVWNAYSQGDLYPTLYRYSHEWRFLVPYLAAGFPSTLTQQGAYWVSTVSLKQGVLWSDGFEVTAEDIAFTADTVNELDLGGSWVSYKSPLHHVEATGRYTVMFYFTQTPEVGTWPFGAGTLPVVSKRYWTPVIAQAASQADPKAWLYAYDSQGEPTGGPFKRSEWVTGNYVEHVADPLYYFKGLEVTEYANGAYREDLPGKYEFTAYGEPTGTVSLHYTYGPYASNVRYILYNSQDEAVQALRDGDVDYILNPLGLSTSLYDSLAGEPGVQAISNPRNGFRYLAVNTRRSPMQVVEFRQAVATLIDREYLASHLQTQTLPVVWSVVLEENRFWYTPTVRFGEGLTRQQRISNTIDLLSGAGFTWTVQPSWDPVGQQVISGQGLHYSGTLVPAMELLAPSSDPLRATAAISIAQWLSEAGIETTAVITDFGTIIDRVYNDQDFDMYILGWSLSTYPGYLCDFFMSTRAAPGDNNAGGYSNPNFDAKCNEFLAETDIQEARQDAYTLQAILANDLPYVTLFSSPMLEAYRSDRIVFPYTTTLDGLQYQIGLPAVVRFVPTRGSIAPSGGTLNGPGSTLTFPPGTFTDTVVVTYVVQSPSDSHLSAGIYFNISAVYSDTGQPAHLVPGTTYTIVVGYDENVLAPGVSESSLMLYYWDEVNLDWVAEPTSVVDPAANTITATPNHFSLWAALGRYEVYLPLVLRSRQ